VAQKFIITNCERRTKVKLKNAISRMIVFVSSVALIPLLPILISTVGAEIAEGTIINSTNIDQYEGYLPSYMCRFVKDGWNIIDPVTIHVKGFTENLPPDNFMKASEENKGKVKLLPNDLIENYESGFPFPDPQEPNKALKIMWNLYYRWRGDDFSYPGGFPVTSKRKGGTVASSHALIDQIFFTCRTVVDPKPNLNNPNNLHWAMTLDSLEPPYKDMVTLVWRYADPTKADDMWTYIPALRRTIRMISSERANPIRGTPTTWDDMYGFDGRPLEFNYKVLKEQTILGLMNQQTLAFDFPSGYPHPIIAGPKDPYELRDTFVVEVVSKDPRYPESKRVLWIPKDIYYPIYGETFDKAGKLWKGTWDAFAKAKTVPGGTGPWLTGASYTDFKTGYWTQNLLRELAINSGLEVYPFEPGALGRY
jgi:hypothetical protein